ncbi:hypothetical protein Pint_30228 [Pistacia integerrima]|uniref:Uncharacterized protein n=1 Tax=Pistacia integerrima TaxID=434235 RepID=A0ACC0X1H0_9ROSI|nr:hypothetical protein Pint_30228 [Pistacia integerrima]
MFSFRTNQSLLLLSTFLFISSTILFSLAHGLGIHGTIDEDEYGVFSWAMRRSVLDDNNVEHVEDNSTLILAADRTHRKDPLDDFNYYKGGWNISEKHYFSVICWVHSCSPLSHWCYMVCGIWPMLVCHQFISLLLSGPQLRLFSNCLCNFACLSHTLHHFGNVKSPSSFFYFVIGCAVLYTGQGKFHRSTTKTLEFVVNQSDTTVSNLRIVSDYLSAAKSIGVDQIHLPPTVQNSIDDVDKKINSSASNLEKETEKNSNDIQQILDAVRKTLIVIASVMLLLALLGFLLSVIGIQFLVYILVTLGWILVTGTFILCGVFLILHNVVGDTCVAMDQWVKNPTAHTALDDILPCVDNATAQEALSKTKEVTFQSVAVVNRFITNVSNINFPPRAEPVYYNQSGPLVPVLCNPFNSDKTDRKCATGEVDFTNAAQEWRKYICQVSATGICTTVGRLTPVFYDQMMTTVNVSYALYHYGPFLVQLGDCTFVRETFSGITEHHCPGLELYSKLIYVGLVMVSTAVMLSLIFWVLYDREWQHRKHTKELIATKSGQDVLEEEKVMQ